MFILFVGVVLELMRLLGGSQFFGSVFCFTSERFGDLFFRVAAEFAFWGGLREDPISDSDDVKCHQEVHKQKDDFCTALQK